MKMLLTKFFHQPCQNRSLRTNCGLKVTQKFATVTGNCSKEIVVTGVYLITLVNVISEANLMDSKRQRLMRAGTLS